MNFLLVVVSVLLLTALVGWLNYRLLARLFSFYRRRKVRYAYLLVTATAILVLYYSRIQRPPLAEPGREIYYLLLYGSLAWLCGQFALLLFQPFLYAADRLTHRTGKAAPEAGGPSSGTMTRRAFLHRTTAAAAVMPLVSTGIGAQGIYQAQAVMVVRQYTLTIPGLPSYLQGFKIGQLSDTHLGPYFNLDRLDTALHLLERQKPDLVLMTGDFADDLSLLRPGIDRLNHLQPQIPLGVYFCLGNHEYLRNVDLVRAEFARSSVVLLENSNRLLLAGPQPLYLMGVDYPGSDTSHSGLDISVSRRLQCFGAASQNMPGNAFKLLMAHHPDFLFDGFAARIPLTFAGHTHGGQVVVGGKALFFSHQYVRGLYQENGVYGCVNSGAGHWFPFRLGCPPEVGVFTLQA